MSLELVGVVAPKISQKLFATCRLEGLPRNATPPPFANNDLWAIRVGGMSPHVLFAVGAVKRKKFPAEQGLLRELIN